MSRSHFLKYIENHHQNEIDLTACDTKFLSKKKEIGDPHTSSLRDYND